MFRIKKHKERVKTVLIVLLSVSAVFLGLQSGLFDEPLRAGGLTFDAPTPLATAGQVSPAALPTAMMATLAEGVHHGHRMDGQGGFNGAEGLSALYDLFASSLGEALGSSGDAYPVNLSAWEIALSGEGVFFQYDIALPGAVFAGWFGTDVGGADGQMQRMILSIRQEAVYLYYTGRGGMPYRSATAVDPIALREKLRTLEPNGAQFGFSNPAWTGADPYTVLLPHYNEIPIIMGHNAIGAAFGHLDEVLGRFGMHLTLARYIDEAGMRTMVEDGATLRLSENGLISFQCQGDFPRVVAGSGGGLPSLSQAIEVAREIAQVLTLFSDMADVYLTNWYYGSGYSDGQLVLTFGYYLGGIPIWTEYPAATIVIHGRYVREATLFVRGFAHRGQFSSVIPELQATAASGGAPLTLTYVSTEENTTQTARASSVLQARWLLTPDAEGVTPHG